MPTPELTPERWRSMEEILLAAWDAPTEKRDALLKERCAGEEALLSELRELLAAQVEADRWVAPETAPEPCPQSRRIGPFELERLIGRGGMGAVYLAHRADGQFEQKVAVKLIGLPFEIESFRERFRRERQILAGLNHPNITRLLDGGVTADGELYLAMEYVDGIGIDQFARQRNRPIPELLRLFRQVCAAVQYAHQNLIIHRDIKPSNILVTPDGVPKLLDFGTAKLMAEADRTQTGFGLMTIQYASPEQLRGEPVSTLTDVFSLGALLFELLAGKRLFAGDLTARLALDASPAFPSCIRGELRQILQKALATDPVQRYSSVEQFSEDVRRYFDGEPILAHPPSVMYRAGKYIHRHRWGVALTVVCAVALTGAAVFSIRQAQVARKEADRARKIAHFSKQTLLSPLPGRASPLSGHPGEITLEAVLDNAGRRAGQDLSSDPATEAEIRGTLGATWVNLGNNAKALFELNRALERSALVKDQPFDNERAAILEMFCNLAASDGNYKLARTHCQNAFATLQKAAQPDPELSFAITHDLAFVSDRDDGPLQEVEQGYRASAETAQHYFGVDDIRWSIAMTRVGMCRYDAGDIQKAASILQPIVTHLRTMPGPPVDLLPALRSLGIVRRTQGRLGEAQALFKEAVDLLHKRPAAYFSTELIELHLLLAQALDGKTSDAAPRNRKLLEALTAPSPVGHIDRAQPELLAGKVFLAVHLYDEGDALLRDAAFLFRAKLPHRPGFEAEALSALAGSLTIQGKTAEAASARERALQLFQAAYGPNAAGHPFVEATREGKF